MGPLQGVRVVEMAGIGPAPFTAMLLADMGADVIRVDRAQAQTGVLTFDRSKEVMNRSRPSVAVELKNPQGVETVLQLVESADILLEGFRPGVMERLGLGPDVCRARNPKLVYGRMTGWGQEGPLAQSAGHDINYIAIAGALGAIGKPGQAPTIPLNLIGDFGGGGMMMAMGLLAAYIHAQRTGEGQVVDAAMVDGANLLMTYFYGIRQVGLHSDHRGTNLLDGGAPFYDTYETKDGQHIAFGAIESAFYIRLLELLEIPLDDPDLSPKNQYNPKKWPALRARLTEIFLSRTRDEWSALFDGEDVCVAPILSMSEAMEHPHAIARDAFVEIDGIKQPAPAPRFEKTPASIKSPPALPGQHTTKSLSSWGFSDEHIEALLQAGAIRQAD